MASPEKDLRRILRGITNAAHDCGACKPGDDWNAYTTRLNTLRLAEEGLVSYIMDTLAARNATISDLKRVASNWRERAVAADERAIEWEELFHDRR